MISAFVSRGGFGYWEKRFAPRPRMRDALLPVYYLNCPDLGSVFGFQRHPVYTLLSNLGKDDDQILREFRANTRNEVFRASKEGVIARTAQAFTGFLDLYNAAAKHKPLPDTGAGFLRSLGKNLFITEAVSAGELLVAHAYAGDISVGRVRLIRSASLFRDQDKEAQKRIGRANRYLHFEDMRFFRRAGFRTYDIGGFDPPELAVPPDIRRVSDFKASFGGALVQEANYLSAAQASYRWSHQLVKMYSNRYFSRK